MAITKEEFERVKNEARGYYLGIGCVVCPYLKQEVYFNNEGFEHIQTKAWNRGRSETEQYTRMRLLPKAVEVVRSSHLIQEYNSEDQEIRQKINSKWQKRKKNVKYYVFIAVFIKSGLRMKVVVKHVEGGRPYFWTAYPSWRVTKIAGCKRKVFYKGNLEED